MKDWKGQFLISPISSGPNNDVFTCENTVLMSCYEFCATIERSINVILGLPGK